MTLRELKKYAVKLIDEYSNNANLTNDEDIRLKLNDLFNVAQIEIASSIRKISKVFDYELLEKRINYVELDLPSDYFELKRIRYFALNNERELDYYTQGNKLKIKGDCLGKYEIEYYAYPKEITQETPDEHKFEIDLDAQMVLPYYVASDILKSDVSANYTSFEAKYNAKLELLMTKKEENMITIHTKYAI